MPGPFDFLGLPLDADERAVKRAYAARLKVTRPEDDPDGFARLVAARDEAMFYVQNRIRYHHWDDDDGDGDDLPDETAVDDPGAPAVADPEPPLVVRSETDGVEPLLVTSPDPDEATRDGAAQDAAAPVVSTDDEDDEDDRAGPGRPSVRGLVDAAAALLTSEDVMDPAAWERILQASEEFDLVARRQFESGLAALLDDALPRLIGLRHVGAAGALALVEYVAAAFDWSGNPRRVAGFLWPQDGPHPLLDQLDRSARRIRPVTDDANRVGAIDDFDLASHFGSMSHRTVRYYQRARARGRYGLSWDWWAFANPVSWCAAIGWYSAAFLLAGLSIWQLNALRTLTSQTLVLLQIAAIFATIGLHLLAGVQSDRIALARLRFLARRASRVSGFRDADRRGYLARAHESNRFAILFAGVIFFMCADRAALDRIHIVAPVAQAVWTTGHLPYLPGDPAAADDMPPRREQVQEIAARALQDELRAARAPKPLVVLIAAAINEDIRTAAPAVLRGYARDARAASAWIVASHMSRYLAAKRPVQRGSPLMQGFLDRTPWLTAEDLDMLGTKAVDGAGLLDPADFSAILDAPEPFYTAYIEAAIAVGTDYHLLDRINAVRCPTTEQENAFGLLYLGGFSGAVGEIIDRAMGDRFARFDNRARSRFVAHHDELVAAACTAFRNQLATASAVFRLRAWVPASVAPEAVADLGSAVALRVRGLGADALADLLASPEATLRTLAQEVMPSPTSPR